MVYKSSESGGYWWPKFGDPPLVYPTRIFTTEYEGEDVTVSAYAGPGGYQFIIGVVVIFALTAPGSVLSSAFLPGYKLPLMCISLIVLVTCAAPAILMTTKIVDPYFFSNCTEYTDTIVNCTAGFEEVMGGYMTLPDELVSTMAKRNGSDFIECVGWKVTSPAVYCTSTAASILPQFGLFQSLAFSIMSNVVFTSQPNESYVSEVLVPNLSSGGAKCTGSTCNFSFMTNLYGQSLGYMLLGAIILLFVGVGIVGVRVFPPRFLINLKHKLTFSGCKKSNTSDKPEDEIEELKEVDEERKMVTSVMQTVVTQPMSTEPSHSSVSSGAPVLSYSSRNVNKESLPPVLMYKLRKEYASLGGAPAKVALKSLDLHVERGRVLGLLGKNGESLVSD